jgi:hypothetical protein
MRDNGDPNPPTGVFDFDADPRAIEPNCQAGPVRDIGADEFYPCAGANGSTITSGPAPGGTTSAAPSFGFSATGGTSFQCSLDGSTFAACSSPMAYEGLASGPHTFAVRNVSLSGNRVPISRSFTVDGSPPETGIDAGPAPGATTGPATSFDFSSEPGATFQCSLDGAIFAACASGDAVTGLATGSHTFVVRAVDAVGNQDPTASSRTWTVDATPPDTSIDSGPADGASTSDTTAIYGFSSEAAATFECSLDGAAFAACTSPKAVAGLATGTHTFAVRATDSHGNVDATPASRTLTVTSSQLPPPPLSDTKAPETTIKKLKVNGDKVKVKFQADESASFTCKLDKGNFKPCTSPKTYKHLDDGTHKVQVQATDAAGNKDPSPARAKFKV